MTKYRYVFANKDFASECEIPTYAGFGSYIGAKRTTAGMQCYL